MVAIATESFNKKFYCR